MAGRRTPGEQVERADPYAGFDGLLALLVDPERHPALHRAGHDERTTEPDPRLDIGSPMGVVPDVIEVFVDRRLEGLARRTMRWAGRRP